jgi:hypothetical protein
MKRTSALVLAGALALGGFGLAACSSGDSGSTAEASASVVGDNPGTWTPISIGQDANGTTIDMVVDQAASFTDIPEGSVVESSDPAVVEAMQAGTDGDASYGAGLVAKSEGTATITVLDPTAPADEGGASNVIIQFEVNVTAP